MPKNAFTDWDTTAANNTDIAGVNIDEGCAPSGINNAIRTVMAQLKSGVPAKVGTTTDNAIARYDGAAGQLQNSAAIISDNGSDLTLTYTEDGASGGPVLQLDRDSASPAASDLIGAISFRGKDSGGAVQSYAAIVTTILDPVATTEDGQMLLQVAIAGTMTTALTLQGTTPFFTTNVGAASYSATGASSGVLLVGAGGDASVRTSTTNTGAALHNYFANPNGVVGSISTTGSATAFNTTSDERLKTKFRDFDSGQIIDGISVYLYDWKTGGQGYGAKAQQAFAVFPDAVTPGNDMKPGDEGFVPWSMDWSKLGPVMWREIQNLRQRLAAAGL